MQFEWFLIDLESASEADLPPQHTFSHWTPDTLVDGKYTRASDIEMAGRLFPDDVVLSAAGCEFREMMTGSGVRPSAKDALAHPWFGTPCVS